MMKNVWQAWDRFWFAPAALLNLALFRICLCLVMAVMYAHRHRDLEIFYSENGILPEHLALKVLSPGMRPPFLLSFWPDAWLPWMHGLLILLLLVLALGAAVRWLGPLALFLQLAFLFRNYTVAFGADQIGTIFLFYLVFTRSDARLSLTSWWRQRKNKSEIESDILTSVFYRLIQVHLCIIYAFSGMEKLKGQSWWDGTAVWSVLANSQMVIADLTWIRHFPLGIVFVTFTTVLFELYFPVLVWNLSLRKWALWAGVLFHSGIGIIMALWSFALIMLCPYFLFIPEHKLRFILRRSEAQTFSQPFVLK
jgi:hypothetical protein